jgi:hypothetical protein
MRKCSVIFIALLLGINLEATTLSIVPSAIGAVVGDTIQVNVEIADVSDLYAFQFDVSFVSGILSATTVSDGGFLSSGFFPGFVSSNSISFVADSLTGPVAGISGSGTLATIQFVAGEPGSTFVNLSNVILLDSNLVDIAADVTHGIADVAAIPEPASYLSIALGLMVIAHQRCGNRSLLALKNRVTDVLFCRKGG